MSSLLRYFHPTYLKNRAAYWIVENLLLSGDTNNMSPEIKAMREKEMLRPSWKRWEIRGLPAGVPTEHPEMPGLWVIPAVLNDLEVESVHSLLSHITSGNSIQGQNGTPYRTKGEGNEYLEWYEYHNGRWMLPLQPYPIINEIFATKVLTELSSTNNTDPLSWPNLNTIMNGERGGLDSLNGARNIRKIQETISKHIPDVKGEECLFIQMQRMERGSRVGMHLDDLVKGGKVISTAVLQGDNMIRVGAIEFQVEPGDVYALARDARYKVEHEVLPCPDDRLSATIRFGIPEEIKMKDS